MTMIIKTKTKIGLARTAFRALRAVGLAGEPGCPVQVRREGVLWSLDLGEGIDFAIYLLGVFERATWKSLRQLIKPGDTVLDIGANIGAHTLHLARAVGPTGRVFAFEATNYAFEKLTKNLSLNPELQNRVVAAQVLLVDDVGREKQSQIYSSWPLEGDAEVHPKHRGKLQSTSDAYLDTLDNLIARYSISRVDVIKIDVDGHEYPVLKGGKILLKTQSPTLVMEISPYVHSEENNSFADLIDLLKECRYSLRDTKRPLLLDSSDLSRMVPDGSGINVIATGAARQ
jgi:FkbM family methyltransferase